MPLTGWLCVFRATAASGIARQTAEEVKTKLKALRKALNGTSGDLATTNAQLRKENEALMELLSDKVEGVIDLSGKKSLVPAVRFNVKMLMFLLKTTILC